MSISAVGCIIPAVVYDGRSGGGGDDDFNPAPWSRESINPAAVVLLLIFSCRH
jgi:hypothetical protein